MNMAEATQTADDKTIEKAVWHYVGIGVLWISLLLSGIALERLGLTSAIFSGILPGEVGSLRTHVTECERNLGTIKLDRDNAMRQEATLREEIRKLRNPLAASPK
jgi:hypothetical protein